MTNKIRNHKQLKTMMNSLSISVGHHLLHTEFVLEHKGFDNTFTCTLPLHFHIHTSHPNSQNTAFLRVFFLKISKQALLEMCRTDESAWSTSSLV